MYGIKNSELKNTKAVTSTGLQLYKEAIFTLVTAKGTNNSNKIMPTINSSRFRLFSMSIEIIGMRINFIIPTCKISFIFKDFSLTLYKNIPKIMSCRTIAAYAPISNDLNIEL